MVSQTNEAALETHIENALAKDGYCIGNPADFDREFAIDGKLFWQFLEATQPNELAKLKDRPNWQRLLLERLSKNSRFPQATKPRARMYPRMFSPAIVIPWDAAALIFYLNIDIMIFT